MCASKKTRIFDSRPHVLQLLGVLADPELREAFRKESWEEQGNQGGGFTPECVVLIRAPELAM